MIYAIATSRFSGSPPPPATPACHIKNRLRFFRVIMVLRVQTSTTNL